MESIYRIIAFSNSILKTSFRFENRFQILPIDMNRKPNSPYARHYPLFLEYKLEYQEIEANDILEFGAKRINKEKEILNLLSCLTNHRFYKYDSSMNRWGKGIPNKPIDEISEGEFKELDNQDSNWILCGYFYQGLKEDLFIDKFTNYSNEAVLKEARMHEYFIDNPIDDYQHEISFPNTLPSALHFYYELSETTRRKVNSSIYLACDGMDISTHKRSLSFLSYISAIEGLVNLEVKDDEIEFECNSCKAIKSSPYTCPDCGRPIWGVKQKFVNFLSKFVAGSEKSKSIYRKIYNLRSQLTHTGKLFLSDYEMSFSENRKEKDENDWLMRLEALQLFRISLDSWLRYPKKIHQ